MHVVATLTVLYSLSFYRAYLCSVAPPTRQQILYFQTLYTFVSKQALVKIVLQKVSYLTGETVKMRVTIISHASGRILLFLIIKASGHVSVLREE